MSGMLSAGSDFENRLVHYFKRHERDAKGQGGAPSLSSLGWDFNPALYNAHIENIASDPVPSATFRFTVTRDMCNYTEHLHGGCATTVIDTLSTLFLLSLSRKGLYSLGGVSRHLHTTYIRPIPAGAEVRLICSLNHAGKKLVLLQANLHRAENNVLCVIGINEKANTDPPPEAKL